MEITQVKENCKHGPFTRIDSFGKVEQGSYKDQPLFLVKTSSNQEFLNSQNIDDRELIHGTLDNVKKTLAKSCAEALRALADRHPFTEPLSIFSARVIKPCYSVGDFSFYGEHDPLTDKLDGRVVVIKNYSVELCTFRQGVPAGKCLKIAKGGQPYLF